MRRKHIFKQSAEEFPDRIYAANRDPKGFGEWLEQLRGNKMVHLELGMGTGDFLAKQAEQHPELFFLGIEIKADRIFKAFQKAERAKLNNIAFLNADIEDLSRYSLPPVSQIYLFFPDPWPKKRHQKRRLSSEKYLNLYEEILKKPGTLLFKTDHRSLFDFTREGLERKGWRAENLPGGGQDASNMTAYEKRFLEAGKEIFALKAFFQAKKGV